MRRTKHSIVIISAFLVSKSSSALNICTLASNCPSPSHNPPMVYDTGRQAYELVSPDTLLNGIEFANRPVAERFPPGSFWTRRPDKY
jgi:hypothetical protein